MPSTYWDEYNTFGEYFCRVTGNYMDTKPFTLEFVYRPVDVGTQDDYTGITNASEIGVAVRDGVVEAIAGICSDRVKFTQVFTWKILDVDNWDELNFVKTGERAFTDPLMFWDCYHYQVTSANINTRKGNKFIPGVPDADVTLGQVTGDAGDTGTPLGKVHAVANSMRYQEVGSGDYGILLCVTKRRKFLITPDSGEPYYAYRPVESDKCISVTYRRVSHNTGRR